MAAYHVEMTPDDPMSPRGGLGGPTDENGSLNIFGSDVVDRVRRRGGLWALPGGQILLPRVFGFCRGVKRALAMLAQACRDHCVGDRPLYLLGQIIHNPWVNQYVAARCVRILAPEQIDDLSRHVGPGDCAIIPAFGVAPPVERRLAEIGCRVVNTTCGDVRRLWVWAERAVGEGYAVIIFGRAHHDETVVTRRRLAEAGGRYLVVGTLDQARRLCRWITGEQGPDGFAEAFGPDVTNADSLAPFARLAQVSQTTMLYDETLALRDLLRSAFEQRYGPAEARQRLVFQPTVCRATQDRQAAAVELCRSALDLVVVVGGFGSSNTRHLHELARGYATAVFIEDAEGILDRRQVRTWDPARQEPAIQGDWLPARRPLRIGVLAGASCPEIVIGQVMEKLAEFLD